MPVEPRRAPPRPLLTMSAETLAAGPPTRRFFSALQREITATPWTAQIAEYLDYVYTEILLRSTTLSRGEGLRQLADHLGSVIKVQHTQIPGDYVHRWQMLYDMAKSPRTPISGT